MLFRLKTELKPKGDQPKAIESLVEGLLIKNYKYQTLLGVTGSGKTFTIASVISYINKPVLVISHNKTLAAQLYSEFRCLFPDNAVHYFVSYYDYYQPEAYIPQTDTYIEKDATINEELDKLRLATTCSLLSRKDVIVVASVSCIYNIGSPSEWMEVHIPLKVGEEIKRESLIDRLISLQYERDDFDFHRGVFRVRGDIIDIFPTYSDTAYRIKLFGDTIEDIVEIDAISCKRLKNYNNIIIYPTKYFVVSGTKLTRAINSIKEELKERLDYFIAKGEIIRAKRLETRTNYDIEMLLETGYCHGIENYSRHFDGRLPGQRPWTLIDYFPVDFLMIIDESHVTIPQLRGMYEGDRARKVNLVEHGFRLPSAFDNRPLKFSEFEKLMPQVIFLSATPASYELKRSSQVVEQIIRPTGLVDPEVIIRPTNNQIEDLMREISHVISQGERVLVTTLTKRMAEDLADYLTTEGFRVRYLHSEIDTLERVEILRDLRQGEFDVLVGINLLREGLDLPEVSLVAVLDADKEGFLRSETSLIQIFGRCARNLNARVIMYADKITTSMEKAISETNRRRNLQLEFNKKHNITPMPIKNPIRLSLFNGVFSKDVKIEYRVSGDISEVLKELEERMKVAADNLQYELAAKLRDEIFSLKKFATKKRR